MYNKKLEICVLCCNKSLGKNMEKIGEVTRQILAVLLTNMNATLFEQPAMCLNCSQRVKTMFDFKSACLYTQDFITPFVDTEKGDQIDLKELYIRERGNKDLVNVLGDRNICRLCLSVVVGDLICLLDESNVDVKYVGDMIKRCIPEVDLNITRNAVVCDACICYLKDYCNFLDKYSEIEDKIERYCRDNGIDKKGRITLAEVLRFCNKKKTLFKDRRLLVRESLDVNSSSDSPNDDSIKRKEHEIRLHEDGKSDEVENSSEYLSQTVGRPKRNITKLQRKPLSENAVFDLLTSAVVDSAGTSSSVRSSRIKWYKCKSCSYKTKQEPHLKGHMLVHKEAFRIKLFRCDFCGFKLKTNGNLKKHMLIHKDPSEIKWFKCNLCNYKSKQKAGLFTHTLVHKDSSRIKWFKCHLCDYTAKYKSSLKAHMLTHRDPSEINWLECASCDFKTKWKSHLKDHMSVHKDPSEIEWFKCDVCDFKTKRKYHLKRHVLTHKDASEIKWLKCHLCEYKSKAKGNLKTHMLIHKNPSEILWFQCDSCGFKAKQKSSLKTHIMLMHKDASRIEWYECDLCEYKGKCKEYLIRHAFVHKTPSEAKRFKCDSCDYKVKCRKSLKKHILKHKGASNKK